MKLILHNFLFLLKRFRTSSILNIIGLSIAYAVFFVIIAQTYYDFSFDRNFEKADNVYLFSQYHSATDQRIKMPPEWVQHIIGQYPEVKNLCWIKRMPDVEYSFDVGDSNGELHELNENVAYTNESFLDAFTPEIIIGDARHALTTDNNAILTESTAKKFFGKADPLGQVFSFHGQNTPITVAAVCKDFPDNCSMKNGIYITEQQYDGSPGVYATYLEIANGGRDKILSKINAIEEGKEENSAKWELTALPDVHLVFPAKGQISRATTLSLFAIGILLMIIAYINFVNFSISMSPVRLKGI